MGERRGMKALELWCKRVTDGYQGVKVENMTTSWRDGLAFCAIIHHFRPELIDFASLNKADIYRNNELAFRTAEHHLGIPALLDAEDMVEFSVPDRLSILTYLSQFYQTFVGSRQSTSPSINRTPPVGKRPASPSMLSSDNQVTPTKVLAVGMQRRDPCTKCRMPVFIAERLLVGGNKLHHRTCFRCARCKNQLSLANCYETEDGDYCCEACPDEVDNKSIDVIEQEHCDPVDPAFTVTLDIKQDVPVPKTSKAMSSFMIGQLQWAEQEVASPLPAVDGILSQSSSSCVQDNSDVNVRTDGALNIGSHVNSASISLDECKSDKNSSLVSNEDSPYFFTKTNSLQSVTSSKEVPLIDSSVSISDNQPSTATNKPEDCFYDQNKLITKCTKESEQPEGQSLVKMRMRMFDQKETLRNTNYTQRTRSSNQDNMISPVSDDTEHNTRGVPESVSKDSESDARDLPKSVSEESEFETSGVPESVSKDNVSETRDVPESGSKENEPKTRNVPNKSEILVSEDIGIISELSTTEHSESTTDDNSDVSPKPIPELLTTTSGLGDKATLEKDETNANEMDVVQDVKEMEETNANETLDVMQDVMVTYADERNEKNILLDESLDAAPCKEGEPWININTHPLVMASETNEVDIIISAITDDSNNTPQTPVTSERKDSKIVYPIDLNPFGDEDEEEDEHKGDDTTHNTTHDTTNPFGSDDDEEKPKEILPVTSTPKTKPPRPPLPVLQQNIAPEAKPTSEELPKISVNPFWSDGEEPSSEEDTKVKRTPVPRPRSVKNVTTLEPSPVPRLRRNSGVLGSNNSMSSGTDSSRGSTMRRKKKPAPPPPLPDTAPPSFDGNYSNLSSPKTLPRHRKARPAPLPPDPNNLSDEFSGLRKISVPTSLKSEKFEKDEANRNKQIQKLGEGEQTPFMMAANKSMFGQWKRKKGPAPPRPVPQRREIRPMPMKEVKRELDDIDIQQLELERQGVSLEMTIRSKFEDDNTEIDDSSLGITPDLEDFVLQLFEIVNEKNELFRRQAELMYLRRQHRLEEEHADLEYEIRCMMDRPEHTKTDTDKASEEEMIKRLVDVVERRNEIVNCLEMDRQREAEEDRSIHEHLSTFTAKAKLADVVAADESEETIPEKKTLKLLKKKIKKSKEKFLKTKEVSNVDAEKDIDEVDLKKQGKEKKEKKRKWF